MKIRNEEELQQVLAQLAELEAKVDIKTAKMNERIDTIKEQYSNDVHPLIEKGKELTEQVRAFAEANKHLFEKTRKKEYAHAFVGFITNPPKVAQLNRKYSVKTSLELLKRLFKDAYIRVKEEMNKEAILADYSSGSLTDDKLAAVGLRIEQEETFILNIKKEELK